MKSDSSVKKANALFAQGQFKEAEALYIEAGKALGHHLFKTNVWLCQKLLADKSFSSVSQNVGASASNVNVGNSQFDEIERLKTQLSKTQSLLEKYFAEAQTLKFQAKDSKQ